MKLFFEIMGIWFLVSIPVSLFFGKMCAWADGRVPTP